MVRKVKKIAIIAALLIANGDLSYAASKFIELHILPNSRVRLDNGPVLTLSQLPAAIETLKKTTPRPDIQIDADRQAPYDSVAAVLAAFQKADYGAHFGFVGIDAGK